MPLVLQEHPAVHLYLQWNCRGMRAQHCLLHSQAMENIKCLVGLEMGGE